MIATAEPTIIPDHDSDVVRHVFGEPLRLGPYIAFRHGSSLAVCTVLAGDVTVRPRINELIDLSPFTMILLWGWSVSDLARELVDFEVESFRVDSDQLLRISPHAYSPNRSHRSRHWHRGRRQHRGAQITVKTGCSFPIATYEELLLEPLSKITACVDRALLAAFRSVASDERTVVFSAASGHELVGFLALRRLRDDYAYFAWSASRPSDAYVSDQLHAAAIDSCVAGGMVVDLGYAPTAGLLSYKQKWEPTRRLPHRRHLTLRRRGSESDGRAVSPFLCASYGGPVSQTPLGVPMRGRE